MAGATRAIEAGPKFEDWYGLLHAFFLSGGPNSIFIVFPNEIRLAQFMKIKLNIKQIK